MKELMVVDLGKMDYQEVFRIQKRLLGLRQKNEISDVLLLVEHPPVITIGIRGQESNVLKSQDFLYLQGIEIHKVRRGGDVTYHGPGQAVGYPILDLKNHGKSIKKFVYNIEEVFLQLLSNEYGIQATRDPIHTGVWVKEKKIAAIGFEIKRWVSMHGFAFNVNTNLEHFRWIIPCGIKDKGVTSLEELAGNKINIKTTHEHIVHYFTFLFGVSLRYIEKEKFIYQLSILDQRSSS